MKHETATSSAGADQPARARARSRSLLALVSLIFGGAALFFATVGLIGLALLLGHFERRASEFDLTLLERMPQRSIIYDMHGEEMGRLHGENRIPVRYEEVAPIFVKALLAREDARFYRHRGVDYLGIARAALVNLAARSTRQGGSTITQQLARNTFPLGGRTLRRKLLEMMVARRIERQFSKEKILEMYMNRIYFGSGQLGIEAASRTYFQKPAHGLDLSEAATLAGLIRSPSRFSPLRDAAAAQAERDAVLNRMVEERMITPVERDAARSKAVRAVELPPNAAQDNWAVDAVRRELDVIFGEEHKDEGGLSIYTTFDPALQAAAEAALEEHLAEVEGAKGWRHPRRSEFTREEAEREAPTRYLQGAVVAVDNRTGGIRAAVGGRDYLQSKLNRAWASRRQVGSTFKPFLYCAAFEAGLLPTTLVSDDPIRPGEVRGLVGEWSPANSDGRYLGMQPCEIGLIRSRNTMSVRVGEFAGIEHVARIGRTCGVAQNIPLQPAIYLGAFETTPKEMAAAFSVLPNFGLRRQAYLIERVDDSAGRILYRTPRASLGATSPSAAWLTAKLLEEVIRRGTAARASSLGLDKPAGGKTGTTNNFKDAWFAGFTSSLTCAVWVGFDEPKQIMPRGYGSALALPVWVKVIQAADNLIYPANELSPPEPLQTVSVCAVSGMLTTNSCREAAVQATLPLSLAPKYACGIHGSRAPREERPNFWQRLFGGRSRGGR